MSEGMEIPLPTGRLIFGHPLKLEQVKDYSTKQVKINPKTGEIQQHCLFYLAVPKTDGKLYGPQGVFAKFSTVANVAMGENPALDFFKWKITDGDSLITGISGQQVKRRGHYHGNWVFKIKSYGRVPKGFYQPSPDQGHQEIVDANMIKLGDYLDVILWVKPNDLQGNNAGLYLNPSLVRFNRAGEEIQTGFYTAGKVDEMFSANTGAPNATGPQPPQPNATGPQPPQPNATGPQPPQPNATGPQPPQPNATDSTFADGFLDDEIPF